MSENAVLAGLLNRLKHENAVTAMRTSIARSDRTQDLSLALPDGARESVTASLAASLTDSDYETPVVLLVTATAREAEDLAQGLSSWMDPATVAHFPSWETLPHERLSPRSDTVGERIAVLRRLAHPNSEHLPALKVVTAPVRSIVQPIVKGLGDLEPVSLKIGEFYDFDQVVQDLAQAAYTRVDMVSRRGEFAVRGGILDVFPPTEAHPYRIDFFGDEIEEIRYFSVADQRSVVDTSENGEQTPRHMYAPACRELLLTESVQQKARELQVSMPNVLEILEPMSQGMAVEGMESLAPLVAEMESFLEVLPEGSLTVIVEPEKVRTRVHDLLTTNEEFLEAAWAAAGEGLSAPVENQQDAGGFATLGDTRSLALERDQGWWQFTAFDTDETFDATALRTEFTAPTQFVGDVEAMMQHMDSRIRDKWSIAIETHGPGPARRLAEIFLDHGHTASVVEQITTIEPGEIQIAVGSPGAGFAWHQQRLAVVTEYDLFGRQAAGTQRGQKRSLARKRRNAVDPLALEEGDFVVHNQHGICKFVELQRRKVSGARSTAGEEGYREYLVLEFAPSKRGGAGDRLFVPTDQLDQVSQYVGGDAPALSKMGGSDWAQTKSKARRATREIAKELIQLYSARMATSGHAFSVDTPWQNELEQAFPHMETPDQLTTVEEVKQDMEAEVPMDRLVAGDVGFGKTEVAVRAAFKAIQDGKQVALLVPTTLLARQHTETFTERFAGFPVTVKALSRFQKAKESRDTINGLAEGTVDLVIGTHRILSDEIQFKDLGLVIVDEEQRFGVEHKEKLKHMRTNVDVLAMTATPIPRTLEMSMTGIRETSTLATPPEQRHPVLTYVGPYTDKQITAAIRRELMREGQVFYVHNRVTSINKVASKIQELIPEARVAVAHGKMSESSLEQIMVDFWEKEYDVLVSTTIIETGLDIANANTLIIEDAQRYGLSQLHQLRGRVGRGRDRAYAYFLYDAGKPLNETAMERLKAVATHNELGSGLQLAQKDLEIRGAGNLLGGEQSGHIAGVGFDLYLRMVGEAVADFKGEQDTTPQEVKVELPVNAHFSHEYIPGERLRLEAYRNLAHAADTEAVAAVVEELQDRYGELPEAAQNLVAVANFRNKAREYGVFEIMLMGKNIKFGPVDELADSRGMRLKRMYPGATFRAPLKALMVPRPKTQAVTGKDLVDAELLEWAGQFIDHIFGDN